MEMGAAACLVNTAIATAGDPVRMGAAFGEAVRAGRNAFLAKAGPVLQGGASASPLTGFLGGLTRGPRHEPPVFRRPAGVAFG